MILQQLQALLNNNSIELFPMNLKAVEIKIEKAERLYNFATRNLSGIGSGDEDIIYNNIYDAVRIACEAVLLINGYRIRTSGEGHHYIIINVAKILFGGQLGNEFKRFQQMRKKRNRIEYGEFMGISESELKQSYLDAKILLSKVKELKLKLDGQNVLSI